MCWLFFHLPFGYEAVAGFFMKVAKWSSLAVFAVLAIFFCPFRLFAVCSSSSLGTGQVKPGFSDLRINSGRKPSLQNTDRNPVVRDQGIFFCLPFR